MTIVSDNKIPKLWESVTCYLSNSKITEDSSSVFQIDSSIACMHSSVCLMISCPQKWITV